MPDIRRRRAVAAVTILILGVTLAACAGSASSPIGGAREPTTGGDLAGSGGAVAPLPGATAAPAGPVAGGSGEQPAGEPATLVDDARIVRTGEIDLQVKDVPTAVRAARDGIRAMGGYIGASTTGTVDDRPTASVTYRIPVARWEDALDLLRGLAGQTTKVVSEHTEAIEVTGAIVDLQARIQNLRASEVALQGIAAKAGKISDVLEVQAQLTQVRGEIESLSAQLKELSDRADYATLTATFGVPVVAVEVATKGWDPRTVTDEALASLVDVLQGLATVGIWFVIVWLPMLAGLAVVAMSAFLLFRRLGVVGPRGPRGGTTGASGPAGGEVPAA